MKRRSIIISLAYLCFSTAVWAHGGFEHVRGAVSKISPTAVTVQTTDNKTVEIDLNDKTTFTRNEPAVKAGELKVGDRVVVDVTRVKDRRVAHSIKLGTAGNAGKQAHQ